MITKLKLMNFKNFKQAEINFGPVSILVGANATGKSNIRDALRFLHGIARGYTLAEIIGEKYGEGGQPQWSWCICSRNIKKAPVLTLPQARRLLEWSLPHPRTQPDYMLDIVRYYPDRNYDADMAHRKRRLKELKKWKNLQVKVSR